MLITASNPGNFGQGPNGRYALLGAALLTVLAVWLAGLSSSGFAQGFAEDAEPREQAGASRASDYAVTCSAACFAAFADRLAAEVRVTARADDAVAFSLERYPGVEVWYVRHETAGTTQLLVMTTIDEALARTWLQGAAAEDLVDVVHQLEAITYVPSVRRHAAAFTAAERARPEAGPRPALDDDAFGASDGGSGATARPDDAGPHTSDLVAGTSDAAAVRADEERRARWARFEQRHGIEAFPPTGEIVANPFRFEGEAVGLIGRFETMLAADVAWLTLGEGLAAVLIDVPRDAFAAAGPVVVAAEVRGVRLDGLPGGGPAPELAYLGALRCLLDDCADVVGEGGVLIGGVGSAEADAVAASFAGTATVEAASGGTSTVEPTSGDRASGDHDGEVPAPGDVASPLVQVTVPDEEPTDDADEPAPPADPTDGVANDADVADSTSTRPSVPVRARFGSLPLRSNNLDGWNGGPFPVLFAHRFGGSEPIAESEAMPFFEESPNCRVLGGGMELTSTPLDFSVSGDGGWGRQSVFALDGTVRIEYSSEAYAGDGRRPSGVATGSVQYTNMGSGRSVFVLDVMEQPSGPLYLNVDFQYEGDGPAPYGGSRGSDRILKLFTWKGCGEDRDRPAALEYPFRCLDSNISGTVPFCDSEPGSYRWPLPLGTAQVVFSFYGSTSTGQDSPGPSTMSASIAVWISND